VACKTEHEVPLGVNRTWVKYIEKGTWPDTKRYFSVMRCNHCSDAPCVAICPTNALHKRPDGIVDFDTSLCIGCKSCMQACPYDALYIDPDEHTAQKCNYCVHRVEVGLEPACVVVCPEQAIIAGDLDDPRTRIAQIINNEQVFVRAPEQGTTPNLFYKGVEQANLDPLMASSAGGYIWRDAPDPVPAWMTVDLTPSNGDKRPGAPPRVEYGPSNPPRVVYNTDHPMPWGWRVSTYFLTKGIAAGLVIAAATSLLAGASVDNGWMRWGTPLVAGLFLLLTGVLLVWDLKRPDRFHYLITRGTPGSWLVRGAYILGAYALILGIWFLAGVLGIDGLVRVMTWIGVPMAIATAGYTAFLFGQAEARDLWQSPMLVWHMVAGACAAGGGVALFLTLFFRVPDAATAAFTWTMVGGAAALGLLAVAELTSRHPTRNIDKAMEHMIRGEFATEWWVGGQLIGVVAPLLFGGLVLGGLGPDWLAALGGLAAAGGIWFSDDAFVKAGQSVPLS
jgi:Fe-S-cluster-containing dehydrogenase component/formate-dependent nitrite reductase membrane component NrfD